jgi:hypothetical protein
MGALHAWGDQGARRLQDARGQGTVEYVGLILLVAVLMAGMVAALKGAKNGQGTELGAVVVGKIKEAVAHMKL